MKLKQFVKEFEVRFTDLNAGNHLSNHLMLGYITDYVSAFLAKHHFDYGNVFDHKVLFSRVNVDFKREVFEADVVKVRVESSEVKSRKLILNFVATVGDNIAAKTTHEICFLKDDRVVSIDEDIANLFAC
ncbi:thioesterase [Vibrio sp. S4M6]|uniref:acyl-CoA thioesterase n=1 Tax=Vibrio sinus TaxID=2946865 RepID=UPI00202A45A7|nr:thioesterase family protein [Vibrio sinus]MCL9781753.1 thioesterase [Vibrio sinus]